MPDNTKVCKGCNKEKDHSDFYRLKYSHDGLQHYCKKCDSVRSAEYLKNRKIPDRYEEPTRICKDCEVDLDIIMFQKHQHAHNGYMSICKACAKLRLVRGAPFKNKKRSKTRSTSRELVIEEREEAKIKRREWHKKRHSIRKETDPIYNIKRRLKCRINRLMKKMGAIKSKTSMKLLGCDIQFFKEWIGSQFQDGMTWDNITLFHLDHSRPCASYNLLDPDQQKQCFRWVNFQPMWAKDNLSKGDKVDWVMIHKHRQKATAYMIRYNDRLISERKNRADNFNKSKKSN